MGYRTNCYGRGQGLDGDKTTSGATCLSTLPHCTENGRGYLRIDDPTTHCPKCGQPGTIIEGESRDIWEGKAAAVDGCLVLCGCPPGSNRLIAPVGEWLGSGPSPSAVVQEKLRNEREALREEQAAEKAKRSQPVFAKSCLRGSGCTEAGTKEEPQENFAVMSFYQSLPPPSPPASSSATSSAATKTEPVQHAQAAKKKASATASTTTAGKEKVMV